MPAMLSRRRILAGGLSAAMLGSGAGRAASLPTPRGKPILTVAGKIGVTNVDGTAKFDRAMLEALGMTSFSTRSPWYKEAATFAGVPLHKLLDRLQAKGNTLFVIALNDYSTEIPVSDARKYPVILALKRDGEYMPVRDKGPIFIVYDYDSDPELKSQKYYSRSVWQVMRIEVR